MIQRKVSESQTCTKETLFLSPAEIVFCGLRVPREVFSPMARHHRFCALPSPSSRFFPSSSSQFFFLLAPNRNSTAASFPQCSSSSPTELSRFNHESGTYFPLGTPNHAGLVFQKNERHSLFSWNSVIRYHSNHGHWKESLFLFMQMQRTGFAPDNFTFPFVIKACAALSAVGMGEGIHCVVFKTGFECNICVQTAFVDMYSKCGLVDTARKLFDEMTQRDLVSWNALLSGYSFNGFHEEALEAFNQIRMADLRPNVSTLVSIIPVITRLGAVELGRSIHCVAVKSGFSSDGSLVPTLVSMYAGCDDLTVARTLFDRVSAKNVVVWNAIISAYARNGKSGEALSFFQLMHRENMRPNLITLVCTLPACGDHGSARIGLSIHACGIKNGFQYEVSVETALISMYAKFGDVNIARFLFHRMQEKNLLSWNSMVSCYIQNGFPTMGLNICYEMQHEASVKPDSVTLVSVLSACTKLKDLISGKSAHAFCVRNGFNLNLNVINAVLAFYSSCNHITTALQIFHKMSVKNILSWDTLISSCVQNGDFETAFALLSQMQLEGVKFDLITFISILPAYCKEEDILKGRSVHGYSIKNRYNSDVSLTNALISMYANCGDLESGRLLFDLMPSRSVVSWNALITAYRYHNLVSEVMVLFNQMKLEFHKPNSVTLLNILPLCHTHLQGKSIHGFAIRADYEIENPFLTSIICMYGRFENLNSCSLLFKMAHKKNVAVWNVMISVYVQNQQAEQSILCFNEMLRLDMEPDSITILTMVSVCARLGSVDLGLSMMAYVIRKGFESSVAVCNALIDMHARCGNIRIAREIFDGMYQRDVVSWSVMISGYGMHGEGDAALSLFAQMKGAGVEPDDVTFIGVLSACSHAGLVEEGRMHFESMNREYKIVPRVEHYSCIVDLLGRTGHVAEAYEFVKTMPFKPCASLLESLLGACSVYGNVQLGEKISGLLFELEPHNTGAYVQLSNIYAAAGRWVDASRLRASMEEKGLRKAPGFSLILR